MRILRLFGVAGLAVTVSASAALAQQAAPSSLGGPRDAERFGAAAADAAQRIGIANQESATARAESAAARAETAGNQRASACIKGLIADPAAPTWSREIRLEKIAQCKAGS